MPAYKFLDLPAGRSVSVYPAAGGAAVSTGTTDTNGVYTVTLALGDYEARVYDGRYNRVAAGQAVGSAAATVGDTAEAEAAAGVNAAGTYPLIRQTGLQSRALRTFHAAIANVAASPCNVLFVGDSITEGSNASTTETRWQARLRDGLRALFQPTSIPGGPGYYPMFYGGAQFTSAWTLVGGSGTPDDFGLGQRSLFMAGTGLSATLTQVGTGFRLIFTRSFATGSFTINLDGAVVATIDTGGYGANTSYAWESGVLTRGLHTLTVTPTSATQVSIEGAYVYDGDETAGVRVWDSAHSGYKVSDYLTLNASWQTAVAVADPSLIFFAVGRNDWSSNVTTAAYATSARTFLNLLITQAPNASLVFLIPHQTTSVTANTTWADWSEIMYTLAAEYGALVIDMRQRWQPGVPTAAPLALVHADEIHLTDKGSQAYADEILAQIAPASPRLRPPPVLRHSVTGAETPSASTNWVGPTQNNLYFYTVAATSTGAQDASIAYDFPLDAGTWRIDVLHRRSTNRGIYSVQVDGTQVGTIDGYAAAADSAKGSVTGVVVTKPGIKRITLKMSTKNGSSSSYFGDLSAIHLVKTA